MKKSMWRSFALLPAVAFAIAASAASAQDNRPLSENAQMGVGDEYGMYGGMNPDLFYNYYPNTFSGATSANMYPAPLPVPRNVGHTYYTYQPLYPHEYMYSHRRTYYTPYATADAFYQGGPCSPGGNGYGLNKTTVTWHSGAFSNLHVPMGIRPMENLRRIGYDLRSRGCNGCR